MKKNLTFFGGFSFDHLSLLTPRAGPAENVGSWLIAALSRRYGDHLRHRPDQGQQTDEEPFTNLPGADRNGHPREAR